MKWVVAGVVMLVAGCSTTAPQYYSLQAPAIATVPEERKLNSDYVISVQPVLVPEQVARPQIVVASVSGAEVVPLNAALWAGPLEAQIRDALADALTLRLNVLDVGSSRVDGLPVWQVFVDVQRFDSVYGESVRQDVVWRLVPLGMPERMNRKMCSAQVQLPVAAGMSALVEGHRQALDMLADLMAETLRGQSVKSTSSAVPSMADEHSGGVSFRGCVTSP